MHFCMKIDEISIKSMAIDFNQMELHPFIVIG